MKRLLLAAAGLSVLVGPMAVSAQPQQDWRGGAQQHQDRGARQAPAGRPDNHQAPQNFRAPQQTLRGPQENFRPPQQSVQRIQPPAQPRNFNAYGNQGAHTTWRGSGPNGAPQPAQPNGSRQYQRYGGSGQVQPYRGGQYQYRNGGQYQARGGVQSFRNWSGSNVRLRGDWWRGRPGFNGYYGRRDGYWFAPGWGYYRVDREWLDFDWVVGSIVPYDLQSYVVSDYWDYGLPAPPYGCEWVFLGDQIVLMDLGSGQIVEIAGAY